MHGKRKNWTTQMKKYLVSNTKLHKFSPYHVLQLQVDSLLVTLGIRVIG